VTVNQLYKLLGNLVARGHGRRRVCIDKPSFRHNLEDDGAVILDVSHGEIRSYPLLDGDGWVATKANGEERMITSLVLTGEADSSFPTPAGHTDG
jgi:hypothetical protein